MTLATLPEWFSAKEFAEIFGMRQTSLNRIANREGWRDALRSDGLPLCAKRSAVKGGKVVVLSTGSRF